MQRNTYLLILYIFLVKTQPRLIPTGYPSLPCLPEPSQAPAFFFNSLCSCSVTDNHTPLEKIVVYHKQEERLELQ